MFKHEGRKFDNAKKKSTPNYHHNTRQQKNFINEYEKMDVRIQQNTFLHYSVPFTVSLKSRKRKGTTTDSQVQKRLGCLLKKHGKFCQSQQEGGFIGVILAATAPMWLPLALKGVKKILHFNGKKSLF